MSNFLSRSKLFSVKIFTNPTIATCDFFARELGNLIGRQHSQFFLHTNVCFLSRGPSLFMFPFRDPILSSDKCLFFPFRGPSQHTLARQSGVCLMPANSHRTLGQCTMFIAHCPLHCTLHNAQCTMFIANCPNVHYNAQCSLHIALTLHNAYCTMHCTAQSTLHSAQYTMHNELKYNMV